MSRLVAITGATGFLGGHLVRVFLDAGWRVRILARKDPVTPLWAGFPIEVVPGDIEDPAALRVFADKADLIIHAAGLVKAGRDADFHRINTAGAGRLADAIYQVAPHVHTILVSSLAAREPGLSAYAASKRAGETAMKNRLGDRLTIVRPCAIYGPGDRETWQLFATAAAGRPLPVFDPSARITMVHVADVARQVLSLADRANPTQTLTICDDRASGYSWTEIVSAVASAVGRRPRSIRIPGAVLRLAAQVSELSRAFGYTPILTAGKARELLHTDWSVSEQERNLIGPVARFTLADGFDETVRWALGAGWLSSPQD